VLTCHQGALDLIEQLSNGPRRPGRSAGLRRNVP
jgi:hypothetical protein